MFDLFFDCCGVHGASFWSFLAQEYMALGVQLRSQRRLRTVLQTASHVASGDFSDFLAAVSGDGVSFDTMPRGGQGLLSWLEQDSRWISFSCLPGSISGKFGVLSHSHSLHSRSLDCHSLQWDGSSVLVTCFGIQHGFN